MPALPIEPHFFGTDIYSQDSIRDEKAYLSLFTKAKNVKRVGEKSPRYLYSEVAAHKIKEFQPSASAIIMLRNPVDQIYSRHSSRVFNGIEYLVDLEAALDAEEGRKRELRLSGSVNLSGVGPFLYIEGAKYTKHVHRYLDILGRENVHVIVFDDFIRDTAEVYRGTLRFLGVNSYFQPKFRKINPSKISRDVRSRNLQNFLRHPPQLVLSFLRVVMPFDVRRQVYEVLTHLNSSNEPRPLIKPALRRKLQEEFLPEVEQLSKLLGRDLTHWCKT